MCMLCLSVYHMLHFLEVIINLEPCRGVVYLFVRHTATGGGNGLQQLEGN